MRLFKTAGGQLPTGDAQRLAFTKLLPPDVAAHATLHMDFTQYREVDALKRFADKYVKVMTSLERQRKGQISALVRLLEAIGSQGEDDGLCVDGSGEDVDEWTYPALDGSEPMNKPRSLHSCALRALCRLAATHVGILCVGQVAVDKDLCKTEGLRGRCLLEAGLT